MNSKTTKLNWKYLYMPIIGLIIMIGVSFKFNPHLFPVKSPFHSTVESLKIEGEMEEYIPGAMRRHSVPGLSMAIIRDGKISNVYHFGRHNILRSGTTQRSSVFEAASLSKPITAYAATKLASLGKIDLDSVITDSAHQYTIRQLLSHTAGFDNQLGNPIRPVTEAGSFSYSGQGYMKVAQIIESTEGVPFHLYMNDMFVKELGMSNSYFGVVPDNINKVNPHVSASFIQLIGLAIFASILILVFPVLLILRYIFKVPITSRHQKILMIISLLIALSIPIKINPGNGVIFALVNLGTAGLIYMIIKGLKYWNNSQFKHTDTHQLYAGTTLGILCFLLLTYLLWFRPPVPIGNRGTSFNGPSGLNTTAEDYATFLTRVMTPDSSETAVIDQVLNPQIAVNENNDWGLGFGIQKGENKAIWHWGVNFPGFQSFFVIWPERKEGIVIFMNGGAMSFTTENPRFSGLELARQITSKIFGGEHYAYWQNVN